MKIKLLYLLLTFCTICYAQENITRTLKNAYEKKKYDLIISQHSKNINDYPAKAIYYVAMAYYMKANDSKVLELMDLSIQKDKTDPDTYYIKGMTFNFMQQFDKAIEVIDIAINLDSSNPYYFSALGDSYFNMQNYEEALSAYVSATEKTPAVERPFKMVPEVYIKLNQPKKALQSFYRLKEITSKESGLYKNTLYNIGLYEFLNKEFDKSEITYKEMIELSPNDYQAYAKLIQVYYSKKEYNKAIPLKEKLYKAYKLGVLTDDLKNMFCFDQFNWKDRLVLAYEKFATEEGKLYYKHVFYVTNKKGDVEFTIQTENSPVSVELGGPKYAIGMDKNGVHSTFGFIKENFKYDVLKSIVVKILANEITPSSSSYSKKPTTKE